MSDQDILFGLVRSPKGAWPRAIAGEGRMGYPYFITTGFLDRLFADLDDAARPPSFLPAEPKRDVQRLPTPMETLANAADSNVPAAQSREALRRLWAVWLLIEDRHRLLDVERIAPLAHQAALVEHVLASPDLRKVLIADEVGLGKTIEVGLIVRRLLEGKPSTRVLYLTEARLVDGVVEEFERLSLRPRRWTSVATEARLSPGESDQLVVASMHRAVFSQPGGVDHFKTVTESGPWDVIVIDEAHHLTDWSADGWAPQERMRLVRALVEKRLTPGGRLLLLSGTPHQGNEARFLNVLRLLSDDGSDEQQARGRVIYRIKDDIRDWDGKPLFPVRKVLPPEQVQVGTAYHEWLAKVHDLFSGADTRAGGWRKGQALQWCASSPQAGLGYLVRTALRGDWRAETHAVLAEAMRALRPYRGGPPEETVEALQDRMRRGLDEYDAGDIDEVVSGEVQLKAALQQGVDLVAGDALAEKMKPLEAWLAHAPDEKFVVFAQPVETVHVLRSRLQSVVGTGNVALIVGDQAPEERKAEIDRFKGDPKVRVLVSSRSGGEGINLQVCRRLVHFDVPWNPMEMEQRVGRVHRYGSTETIIVYTLVLAGSREEKVLRRCQARLAGIARDIDQDRFEAIFSRTMALVPQGKLAEIMAGESFGQLTREEGDRLDHLVQEGYRLLKQTEAEFRSRAAQIRTVERGPAVEDDFRSFLEVALGAERVAGWTRTKLDDGEGGETRVLREPVAVHRLASGTLAFFGADAGITLKGPDGSSPPMRIGLNSAEILTAMRACVVTLEPKGGAPVEWGGAASVSVPAEDWARLAAICHLSGSTLLLAAYAIRRLDVATQAPREVGSELVAFVSEGDGAAARRLTSTELADVLRAMRAAKPSRRRPRVDAAIKELERVLVDPLLAQGPGEPVPAIFPLAAIAVETTEPGDG